MKKVTKELIMQKITEKYVEENPDMMKDIIELAGAINFFNLKWGTKLTPTDFLSTIK